MADHTKSLSNTVSVYGASPTSKWNVALWNVNTWGENGDVVHSVGKFLGETLSLSDSIGRQQTKQVTESLAFSSDALDMFLIDANGWYRVFPKPTTDSDERTDTTWGEV